MTFPMSENKSIKILMDDESSEENQKSAKEIEDDKRAEKEAQQKLVSMETKILSILQYQAKIFSRKQILPGILMPVSKNIHCLSFQDDIALLVCIIVIMALTVFVVVIKVRQLGPLPFSPQRTSFRFHQNPQYSRSYQKYYNNCHSP